MKDSDAVELKRILQVGEIFVFMAWMYTRVLFINNVIIFSVRFELILEKKAIYFLIIYLDYLVFSINQWLPINPLRLLYSCTFHCRHNHE